MPLAQAIYETFKLDFWLGACCQLWGSILQVMAPFTLRYLIKSVELDQFSLTIGIGYVFGLAFMEVLQSFASAHFYYRGMLLGAQGRSVLISLIFSKSLKLSNRAKVGGLPDQHAKGAFIGIPCRVDSKGWSNGRVMSLISTDVARIEQALALFHLTWLSLFQIALTVILLLYNLGYAALAGVAILGMFINSQLGGFVYAISSDISYSSYYVPILIARCDI